MLRRKKRQCRVSYLPLFRKCSPAVCASILLRPGPRGLARVRCLHSRFSPNLTTVHSKSSTPTFQRAAASSGIIHCSSRRRHHPRQQAEGRADGTATGQAPVQVQRHSDSPRRAAPATTGWQHSGTCACEGISASFFKGTLLPGVHQLPPSLTTSVSPCNAGSALALFLRLSSLKGKEAGSKQAITGTVLTDNRCSVILLAHSEQLQT